MHGAAENPGERRLECKRPVAVECHGGDAKIRRKLELSRLRSEGGVGAVKLEPAAAAEVALGAGLGSKRFMLGNGTREQRPHRFCCFDQPRRPRRSDESREPRRGARQKAEVIIDLRRALERDAQERAPIRRKGRRKERLAGDDAGVAVGGPLAHRAAVDERDRQAALGEMDRAAGADNAGAEHDDIGLRHEPSAELTALHIPGLPAGTSICPEPDRRVRRAANCLFRSFPGSGNATAPVIGGLGGSPLRGDGRRDAVGGSIVAPAAWRTCCIAR